MNKMQCYKVACVDSNGNEHEVGVMTFDSEAAKRSAEKSLLEGKHIKAKAIKAIETEAI